MSDEVQPEETTITESTDTVDLAIEAEKWKQLARKHEDRAKANADAAKELEQLKQSMLTETEKAIEQAKAESRKATVLEYSSKLVEAKLESYLNGKVLDANALLSFNKSAFITDDGDINDDALRQWVESNTASPEPTKPVYPDLGQGNRGAAPALNSDPLLADLKAKLGID